MDFIQFCRSHGLILDRIEIGRWVRTPTESHPRRRNGAYKFLGDVGFCQDHANMADPATWFSEKDSRPDPARLNAIKRKAHEDIGAKREKAASKAKWIISQCTHEQHAYFDSKGFPEEKGLVWRPDENQNLLVIPMRVGGNVVGCQMIDRDGNKRFLSGQQCSGAEYVIDAKGVDIWCEGYATALSIKACLGALRARYRVHVCFSAGNMQKMATGGIVVADNDASETGRRAAEATGLPFFMPPEVGHDFNDYHRLVGTFKASQALRKEIMRHR